MKSRLYATLVAVLSFVVFPYSVVCAQQKEPTKPTTQQPRHELYFPWGGIDQNSYMYWPTNAPDTKPLLLAKAGRRDLAFSYCLTKLDSATGTTMLFYSVQAASMGYGLVQSHEVIQRLLPKYRSQRRLAVSRSRSYVAEDPDLALSLAFATTLSIHSTSDIRSHKGFKALQNIQSNNSFEVIRVLNDVRNYKFTSSTHQAIMATLSHLLSFRKPSPEDQWKPILQADPDNPSALLIMATLTAVTIYGSDATGKIVPLYEPDPDAPLHYAELAFKHAPNNVRAIFSLAQHVKHSDPARAKALLTRYLAIGTGPEPEKAAAKRMLAELSRGKLK